MTTPNRLTPSTFVAYFLMSGIPCGSPVVHGAAPVVLWATPQGMSLRSTLLPREKDGVEARLAHLRAFQSVLDLGEREHLEHGANACLCGKG